MHPVLISLSDRVRPITAVNVLPSPDKITLSLRKEWATAQSMDMGLAFEIWQTRAVSSDLHLVAM